MASSTTDQAPVMQEYIFPPLTSYQGPEVERVAEAIFWAGVVAEGKELLGAWEMLREPVKSIARVQAMAAIAAIRKGEA